MEGLFVESDSESSCLFLMEEIDAVDQRDDLFANGTFTNQEVQKQLEPSQERDSIDLPVAAKQASCELIELHVNQKSRNHQNPRFRSSRSTKDVSYQRFDHKFSVSTTETTKSSQATIYQPLDKQRPHCSSEFTASTYESSTIHENFDQCDESTLLIESVDSEVARNEKIHSDLEARVQVGGETLPVQYDINNISYSTVGCAQGDTFPDLVGEAASEENPQMEKQWSELQLVGSVKVFHDTKIEDVVQARTKNSNQEFGDHNPDLFVRSHFSLHYDTPPVSDSHTEEMDNFASESQEEFQIDGVPSSVNIDDASAASPLAFVDMYNQCIRDDDLNSTLDLHVNCMTQHFVNDEFHFNTFLQPYHFVNENQNNDKARPPDITKLEWIPKLIIFLSSDRRSIVEASLSELAQMGCIEDHTNYDDELSAMGFIESAYDGGAHSSIIGAMNRWYEYPSIQLLGCQALHNLCINKHFREAAARTGAFETLLQAMTNFPTFPELEKLTCACLCCLTSDKTMATYFILELDGMESIVRTMEKYIDDSFVQLWSCSAINYTSNFPDLVKHIESGRVLSILFDVIKAYNDTSNPDHYLIQNQARESIKRLI